MHQTALGSRLGIAFFIAFFGASAAFAAFIAFIAARGCTKPLLEVDWGSLEPKWLRSPSLVPP